MAPTSFAPTAQTLEVPGARLYYKVRGKGPLVVLVGAPMDARSFGPLAELLAGDRTVLTTDPRGINRSPVDDPDQDSTPRMRADDLSRLVAHLDAGPAVVLGSSGGAVSALALVQAHPGQVRTVVAHEPPLIELLPDRAERHAGNEDVIGKWLAGEYVGSWAAFLDNANIHLPEGVFEAMFAAEPDPQAIADTTYQNTHMLRPTTHLAARHSRPALGGHPGRGRHRRGFRGPGLRPYVAGTRHGTRHRAHDVPRWPYGVRRGSRRVRHPAAFGPAGGLTGLHRSRVPMWTPLKVFATRRGGHGNARTVVDRFVASRPDLDAADREMLLGWRDPVEGIFGIRRKDRDAIILLNLIADLEYRTYSNMGRPRSAASCPR